MEETKEAAQVSEPAADTPAAEAEKPADSGKLFTQEEVNRIIKERLSRQKIKANEDQEAEYKNKSDDLAKRETDLKAKETRFQCKEYLFSKGYSNELLEILDTNDFESFKKKADKVNALQHSQRVAPISVTSEKITNETGAGFAKGLKHKPKTYY